MDGIPESSNPEGSIPEGRNREGTAYAEHVTDGDLKLLAAVTGSTPIPEALPRLLADPRVFQAISGAIAAREAVLASPFLAFAVAVHRTAVDLATVGYVTGRSPRAAACPGVRRARSAGLSRLGRPPALPHRAPRVL